MRGVLADSFENEAGTDLQSLYIDRKNCEEKCMGKEPVCNKDYDGENTKLPDGADGKDRNDTKNRII